MSRDRTYRREDRRGVIYDGRVKVTKLDVDANQDTAARFDVRSIPSILYFQGRQARRYGGKRGSETAPGREDRDGIWGERIS